MAAGQACFAPPQVVAAPLRKFCFSEPSDRISNPGATAYSKTAGRPDACVHLRLFPELGTVSAEAMFENWAQFMRRVLPVVEVVEKADVVMAGAPGRPAPARGSRHRAHLQRPRRLSARAGLCALAVEQNHVLQIYQFECPLLPAIGKSLPVRSRPRPERSKQTPGRRGGPFDDFAFPRRVNHSDHLSIRQYARLVDEWVTAIGLRREEYGTQSLRGKKPPITPAGSGTIP